MEFEKSLEPLSPVVTRQEAIGIAEHFGTPVYVYSQLMLEEQADKALSFPNAFGLTVRYAMKANPNQNILRIFNKKGIKIDASSSYEALRAIKAGIDPHNILLTSKLAPNIPSLTSLINSGVEYNACSLKQLENYGKVFPNSEVSVRINPGLGSGHNNRTNTGGESSPFGIWFGYIKDIFDVAQDYSLLVTRIHTHIGSGSDPEVWKRVARMSLDNVEKFLRAGHPVKTLNLGGGYKVSRMADGCDGKTTDLQECGEPIRNAFVDFAKRTGVELKLEIEPGTYLVANAECVIARVEDIVSTPKYKFIITDSGMNEVTRPSLYGAQHPITVINLRADSNKTEEYVVCGKCCESGDILTPEKGDSEAIATRRLREAKVGDLVVIGGTGAYCSSMSTVGYNSFTQAPEVLIDNDRNFLLIRRRQTLDQMLENEINVI